ncbi:M56 family metallopeptidase [Arenimonas daejeonensis]|uniref:M56 family metallopeptidase n=1 Tax=Arenimonas daejeonensis TaxID=370777 RepID=UPI0011BFD46A|nr:M56 family metallopeptidase [Arenimonas daejeonensis]
MNALDLSLSLLLTFALHASLLLGAAWLAERLGLLRHPGVAELVWRLALFGALVTTGLHVARLPAAPENEAVAASHASAGRVGREEALRQAQALASSEAARPRLAPAVEAAASVDPMPIVSGPVPADAAASQTMPAATTAAMQGTDTLQVPALLAGAMLALWLLVTGTAALRLGAQMLALHRLRRRSAPLPPDASTFRHAADIARGFGLASPPLRAHAGINSPMALPGGAVLLPDWATKMPEAQQRALLAHEFAHLHRHDPAWRLLQRLALLPLSFHPLAHHAVRRLEAIAEDACDAHAAQRLGSGRALAECLAACLSHAGARAAHPTLAVAMAGDAGPVVRRVQNLLEDIPMSPRSLSPATRRTALTIALAAAIALPGLAVSTYAPPAQAGWLENIFENTSESYSYRSSENGESLSVKLRGKVGFNEAETDVVRLAAGADLRIEETRGGITRKIRFHGVDGKIVRDYEVEGDEKALDAEGRAWLAALLPRVLRESAIDADARGKRILARGGANALLAEIDLIKGDYAARRYLEVLFENTTLDAAQLKRALAAANDIGSDFEMRHALTTAFDGQKLTPEHQAQVLASAMSIGSDFELAELLSHFAQTQPVTGAALPAWQRALATIGSDFEHRRVLDALVERGRNTPGAARVALESTADIGSDFELRQVLENTAPATRDDAATLAAWFRAAEGVGSDFEHRVALEALIEAGPVDVALANGVLTSVEGIGGDFEARVALEALAGRMPNDPALIERYRAAARGLGDFERGQAEKALDRFYAAN